MPREVARGQVDLDVAAIVAGMARAHGAQEVASLPKWWRASCRGHDPDIGPEGATAPKV
jgi:hypothetical protein